MGEQLTVFDELRKASENEQFIYCKGAKAKYNEKRLRRVKTTSKPGSFGGPADPR